MEASEENATGGDNAGPINENLFLDEDLDGLDDELNDLDLEDSDEDEDEDEDDSNENSKASWMWNYRDSTELKIISVGLVITALNQYQTKVNWWKLKRERSEMKNKRRNIQTKFENYKYLWSFFISTFTYE